MFLVNAARFPHRVPSPAPQRRPSSFLDPFAAQRFKLCQTLTLTQAMGSIQPPPRRPFCHKCSKPARVCLCSRMKSPPIDNPISVTILQHSLEKNHPLNSTRVASLGLKNLKVVPVTDVNFRAHFVIRPMNSSPHREVDPSYLEKISKLLPLEGGISKLDLEVGSVTGNVSAIVQKSSGICQGNVKTGLSQGRKKRDAVSIAHAKSNGNVFENCGLENVENQLDEVQLRRNTASPTKEEKMDFMTKNTCSTGFTGKNLDATSLQDTQTRMEKSEFDQVENEQPPASDEDGFTATFANCSVTCNPSHLLVTLNPSAKPDLSWVLASPIGKTVISNGFIVKKVQRKELRGSLELEDYEEFNVEIPLGSALLYPSKNSIGMEAVDFEVRHLIVLDGTWSKARRMYYENPWLKLLPHLRLDTEKMSLYSEVRHQPKAGCLSTIESIVCAMKALGDDVEGLDNLLDVFESMVEDQRHCKKEKFSRMSRS